MLRHCVSKSHKLLAFLFACVVLFTVCCVGCSSGKNTGPKEPAPKNAATRDPAAEKPAAMDPVVPMPAAEKAERYGTVVEGIWAVKDYHLYQEPGNKKSPVMGEVKMGDPVRILDEKDYFLLVETEDKKKGWLFKHFVAEFFFTGPEEKKIDKLPVPDALAFYGPAFEENPVEPAIWYEVSPKTDLDLYAFPYVQAPVVAKAKANKRYLITDTAMVGFPKLSYREFPNGVKGSHLFGITFDASYFYLDGKVFLAGPGSEYKAYSGFKNIDRFDPAFKDMDKFRNLWLRLQTEDGTEGWTRSYWYEESRKSQEVWNQAVFFAGYGGLNMYLHAKEHPIKIVRGIDKTSLHAGSSQESELLPELSHYEFLNQRVKVLEEKDGWSRIRSYRNGLAAWVRSEHVLDYKEAYAATIEKKRERIKKDGTSHYSAFALQEFPKESEMPKLPTKEKTGVIVGTEVRMRDYRSTESKIVGYFEKGEKVVILDKKSGWFKVRRADNSVGWVRGDLCKVWSE